jgi:5-bromo-4-chloroindolyl phosphate hydrolysis protein
MKEETKQRIREILKPLTQDEKVAVIEQVKRTLLQGSSVPKPETKASS